MFESLKELRIQFPHTGTVEWIGVRGSRDEPMLELETVSVVERQGLLGDRYSAKRTDNRAVTLIQAEHLDVIRSLLPGSAIEPAALRRNIVVRGINLNAMKEVHIEIGSALLQLTGMCHPCSKMERRLGVGAYNAMRGHGGITARVLRGGDIAIGDEVRGLQVES